MTLSKQNWRIKGLVILLIILWIASFKTFAQPRQIAITIDDLPATGNNAGCYQYITDQITNTLKVNSIHATGFVNEGKLYVNGKVDSTRIKLLEQWLSAGQDLGNHTYSHVYIDNTNLVNYQRDILQGEIITRPLALKYGKHLSYFRHPQLRTGPTDDYRRNLNLFLTKNEYVVAPVTIDNDEYIYAYCYDKARRSGDTIMMKSIADDYLQYMKEIFKYYEQLSSDFLGYDLPQILLLHANNLNADYLPALIVNIKDRGYQFVSLDEALKDKAYKLSEGTHLRGLSWINRWIIASGGEVPDQPDVSVFIYKLFSSYQ